NLGNNTADDEAESESEGAARRRSALSRAGWPAYRDGRPSLGGRGASAVCSLLSSTVDEPADLECAHASTDCALRDSRLRVPCRRLRFRPDDRAIGRAAVLLGPPESLERSAARWR